MSRPRVSLLMAAAITSVFASLLVGPAASADVIPDPAITSLSTSLDSNGNDPAGVVGQSVYDFKLTAVAGPVTGFVYSVTSSPNSAFPVNLDVSCGSRVAEYTVVCSPNGNNVTVKAAPVERQSSLSVVSFTKGSDGQVVMSAPVYRTFTVGQMNPMPTTVLPVALSAGASVVDVETFAGQPTGQSCQGTLPPDADVFERGQAFQFATANAFGKTVGAAIDASRSFTMSTWFCAASTNSVKSLELLTQTAKNNSQSAALTLTPELKTQLTVKPKAGSKKADSVNQNQALSTNRWYFVAAIYDQLNRQLRISVTTDGMTSTWTVAAASGTQAKNKMQNVVLGATSKGKGFVGQLYHPVLAQGVLTPEQISSTAQQFNGQLGVLK